MSDFPARLMDNVLAPNATHYERVLASQSERMFDLDTERLRNLWNPWLCHPDDLPFLAWALSVDIWDANWDLPRKRRVVANAIDMHRHKGTLYGIERYLNVYDVQLRKAVVPPAFTLLMPALTDDDRQDFLERFAQLRIYPYVANGTYPYASFTNKAYKLEKAFLGATTGDGGVYPWNTFPHQRYRRIAKLWDQGEETDLSLTEILPELVEAYGAKIYDLITLPSKASGQVFPNSPPKANLYLSRDRYVGERIISRERSVNLTYESTRELRSTLDMSLELINVEPQFVFEQHQSQGNALYVGGYINGHCLPPTISWQYIYERWFIHDPDRVPDERRRSTHLGFTRLGMPAYHAELNVRIESKAYSREAWNYVSGYLHAHDNGPIERTLEAVRNSKALRDKVLIDTKTYRQRRVSDRTEIGSAALGELVET